MISATRSLPEVARRLYDDIRSNYLVRYDAKQTIGKRYARMDEAGTPYCITVDEETLTNGTVIVRERDSLAQQRIANDQVKSFLLDRIMP